MTGSTADYVGFPETLSKSTAYECPVSNDFSSSAVSGSEGGLTPCLFIDSPLACPFELVY